MILNHKNILLDIGGTLVTINESFEQYTKRAITYIYPFFESDTNTYVEDFVIEVLGIRNSIRAKAHETLIEFSFEYFIQEVCEKLNLGLKSSIREVESKYIEAELEVTKLNDGVLEFLNKAKEANKKLIVATNNFSSQHVETLLNRFEISPFLDEIYISAKMAIRKPSTEFVNNICKEQQLNKEETVIIGDKLSMDIKAANNSKIDSAYFNPSNIKSTDQNIPCTFEFTSFNQILF